MTTIITTHELLGRRIEFISGYGGVISVTGTVVEVRAGRFGAQARCALDGGGEEWASVGSIGPRGGLGHGYRFAD